MPSLRTAFAYLINMGLLGLFVTPIAYLSFLVRFWDYIDSFYVAVSLTFFGLTYFGQMCGVVVLGKLDDHLHNHPEGIVSDRTEKLPKKPSEPLKSIRPDDEVVEARVRRWTIRR